MYKCHVCHSTYSHPGNFKQHLLKHEREKRGAGANSEGSHLNSVLQSAFGRQTLSSQNSSHIDINESLLIMKS